MKRLVAVDLEEGSEAVLRFAADLVRESGGSVHALHVVTKDEQEAREHIPGVSRYADVMVEEVERDLGSQLAAMGVDRSAMHPVARIGTFVETVLSVAREAEVAAIVVGMRRRSRVGKFLLGSDLRDLLLAADRPVVTVPIDREPAG